MSSPLSRTILLTAIALSATACGSAADKGPKKAKPTPQNNVVGVNNTANNATANNTTANNTVPPNNAHPCVSVTPANVTFPQIFVGQSAQASVVVENCSTTEPLVLLGIVASDGFDALLPELDTLAPLQTATIVTEFSPSGPGSIAGQISLETNAGPAVISVQGSAIESELPCPIAVARGRATSGEWVMNVVADAGSTVELTGAESMANGPILEWEWTIASRPVGSSSTLSPSASVESPMLFLDAEGVYEVDLRVRDSATWGECPAARLRIDSRSTTDPNEILVQLVWDTPGDADQTDEFGTDLDLHYLHPLGAWNTTPYDCYWLNKMADWGADGLATVDIDDLNGMGPENISHRNAGPLKYQIGVYYYADNGYGPSTATVRVFRGGALLGEMSQLLADRDDFWRAAEFNAATNSITPIGLVSVGFP